MSRTTLVLSLFMLLLACSKQTATTQPDNPNSPSGPQNPSNPPQEVNDVFDDDPENAPRFVSHNYIEIDSIGEISMFRSGIGHDYSDDFEYCRSMKHYFKPKAQDWSTVKIYSPVKGEVVRIFSEWAGSQIHIKSDDHPAFTFRIFHVNLNTSIKVGDHLDAGSAIGTHISTQTMSDIAVAVNTSLDGPKDNSNSEQGLRLISIFQVMSDSLMNTYAEKGIENRQAIQIQKQERDNSMLDCDGESFASAGSINNWFVLQ